MNIADLNYYLYMFHDNEFVADCNGCECMWMAGLAEVGGSNIYVRAYGTIKMAH